jgi:hypothetical protein
MVVLSYCSPMEIQHALQQPHNTTIDILAIVAAVDASDRTLYYPDKIREVAWMIGMFRIQCSMDMNLHIFSINILVLCAVA